MPKILEGICAELSFPWVSQFSFFFFPFFFGAGGKQKPKLGCRNTSSSTS